MEASLRSNPPRIMVGGGPASGRTTQSGFLAEDLDIIHVNVADLLREEELKYNKKDEPLPDGRYIDIIQSRIQENDCSNKGWLLDGFPLNERQYDLMTTAGLDCDLFAYMDTDETHLRERISNRRYDPTSGKVYYATETSPEYEDVVSRLVVRPQDTGEGIDKQIEKFFTTLPTLRKRFGNKAIRINGNLSITDVKRSVRMTVYRSFFSEVLFVLGGPGAGKGTVCSRLVYEFGYTHLSAGDLLREERAKTGGISTMINKIINEGGIVPAKITVGLIAAAMKESGSKKFLVDGFPRNVENLLVWYELMSDQCIVDSVLNLDLDEDTMKARLLERGKTSGRSDDNEATITKRFRTFNVDTKPVLDLYSFAGKLRTISSVPPPEIVFSATAKLFRAQQYFHPYQRTFAFIKPDAVRHGRVPEILAAIADAHLAVVGNKLVEITSEAVADFYKEHVNKPFFADLERFMTSGPAVALVLEGSFAVKAWRQLMGPTNSHVARTKAPASLRARFGTDNTMNACHGSDSECSALREIRFWFDPSQPGAACEVGAANNSAPAPAEVPRPGVLGLSVESTYAMIKPVTASLHADAVLAIVAAHGFEVVGELRTTLSLAQAQLFYEEHRGKEFFGPLTAYMSSGPIVGLHLRRAGAVAGWRHLIGPTNLEKAQNERPDSIRAKFGIDKTRNAVHGSDSQGSAMREISFFFSFGSSSATSPVASAAIVSPPSPSKSNTITLSPVKIPPGKARSPYTKKVHTLPSISISRKDIPVMQEYASYEVDPVMRSLLERVMVSRPSDVAAFAIAELNGDQNRKK